mgnify:CR=1 FL=1
MICNVCYETYHGIVSCDSYFYLYCTIYYHSWNIIKHFYDIDVIFFDSAK